MDNFNQNNVKTMITEPNIALTSIGPSDRQFSTKSSDDPPKGNLNEFEYVIDKRPQISVTITKPSNNIMNEEKQKPNTQKETQPNTNENKNGDRTTKKNKKKSKKSEPNRNNPMKIIESVLGQSECKKLNYSQIVDNKFNSDSFKSELLCQLKDIQYLPTVGETIDGLSDIVTSVLPLGVEGIVNIPSSAILKMSCINKVPDKRQRKKLKKQNTMKQNIQRKSDDPNGKNDPNPKPPQPGPSAGGSGSSKSSKNTIIFPVNMSKKKPQGISNQPKKQAQLKSHQNQKSAKQKEQPSKKVGQQQPKKLKQDNQEAKQTDSNNSKHTHMKKAANVKEAQKDQKNQQSQFSLKGAQQPKKASESQKTKQPALTNGQKMKNPKPIVKKSQPTANYAPPKKKQKQNEKGKVEGVAKSEVTVQRAPTESTGQAGKMNGVIANGTNKTSQIAIKINDGQDHGGGDSDVSGKKVRAKRKVYYYKKS